VLPSPPETINFLLTNLRHAAESDLGESEKMLVIESTLALLLVELKQALPQKQKHHSSFSLLIQQALAYIDTNYSQEITVKRIAEALKVCTSTL
jgi:YesN/AraC family two-component response regulator